MGDAKNVKEAIYHKCIIIISKKQKGVYQTPTLTTHFSSLSAPLSSIVYPLPSFFVFLSPEHTFGHLFKCGACHLRYQLLNVIVNLPDITKINITFEIMDELFNPAMVSLKMNFDKAKLYILPHFIFNILPPDTHSKLCSWMIKACFGVNFL